MMSTQIITSPLGQPPSIIPSPDAPSKPLPFLWCAGSTSLVRPFVDVAASISDSDFPRLIDRWVITLFRMVDQSSVNFDYKAIAACVKCCSKARNGHCEYVERIFEAREYIYENRFDMADYAQSAIRRGWIPKEKFHRFMLMVLHVNHKERARESSRYRYRARVRRMLGLPPLERYEPPFRRPPSPFCYRPSIYPRALQPPPRQDESDPTDE